MLLGDGTCSLNKMHLTGSLMCTIQGQTGIATLQLHYMKSFQCGVGSP